MPNGTRTIAVIIPTLNERDNIASAVASAVAADQIVVVDGGSTDGTCELVSELPCLLVHAPPGRGSQLREGARRTTCEVLLFLHADCRLGERALDELRAHVAQSGPSRIFGAYRQHIEDEHPKYRWLEWGNALRVSWLRLPYGDQSVFIDRATYSEAGQFSDVPLMEDVLLARAVRRLQRPVLMHGPVHVSARRWQRTGVILRTCRNLTILAAFYSGVSPRRLAHWYG